jgi:MFS family permease
VKQRPRAVLSLAAATHFVHDGFADILYVLLPLWAREFGLSFAEVGVIRTVYSGAMALFQIPAGFLAERWGERRVLAAGTAVTAGSFILSGWTGGFASLLLLLLVAGLGSGVQHPLSSTLVSKAYETGARRTALGTYNFSGDLGKVAVPAVVGSAAALVGWRAASAGFGVVGLLAAGAILIVLLRLGAGEATTAGHGGGRARAGWGIRDRRGFQALSAIGIIDSGTRTPFLTLLPFVLISKGLTTAQVGWALALLFAGGAVGKFVCGLVAERLGVIRTVVLTEAATAAGILTVIVAPLGPALGVLAPLGVALNGTSSVLYGTVADLVSAESRSRSYGLYYTLTIGASALAPTLYGALSDVVGVPATLTVVSTVVLVTIPLCGALRPAVAAAPRLGAGA